MDSVVSSICSETVSKMHFIFDEHKQFETMTNQANLNCDLKNDSTRAPLHITSSSRMWIESDANLNCHVCDSTNKTNRVSVCVCVLHSVL